MNEVHRHPAAPVVLGLAVVLHLVVSLSVVVSRPASVDPVRDRGVIAAAPDTAPAAAPTSAPSAAPSTTAEAAPATSAAPSTTTTAAPPPPTTAPPTSAAPVASPAGAVSPWTLQPYDGLGAWVDVYDWTETFTRDAAPRVGPLAVDRMAELGVQTVYIQTAHHRADVDVLEPARLASIVDRAHQHGMAVVAWYLPTLEDLELDLRRLLAGAAAGVDGLGVDIEARHVADPAERNRRLVELGRRLREAVGDRTISAITPSAVHLQVVNPSFWPDFPWVETAATYDVIQPMAYFSIRRGEYRSGERYIGENIDRIRASTGDPEVPVHPIGGIADGATIEDLEGMVRASVARGAIGGSLYDWSTSNPAQWAALAPFRAGPVS